MERNQCRNCGYTNNAHSAFCPVWLSKIQNQASSRSVVTNPPHYTTGKIETIDFIQDKELNFSKGNAVKYIVRAGKKDPTKEVEDLEKAIQYLQFEIRDVKRRG